MRPCSLTAAVVRSGSLADIGRGLAFGPLSAHERKYAAEFSGSEVCQMQMAPSDYRFFDPRSSLEIQLIGVAAPVGEARLARKLQPIDSSKRQGTMLVPHPDARGLIAREPSSDRR